MSTMTKAKVLAAQDAWGEGLLRIAKTHSAGKDFESIAQAYVQALYAYDLSAVLFKPTLAAEIQFRSTFEQAVSYFVAANGACSEDAGFAIKGWTAVRFENVDIIIAGETAVAMGNYFFTDPDGAETKVEYSFGYLLDENGQVRINLHHSSLPYSV